MKTEHSLSQGKVANQTPGLFSRNVTRVVTLHQRFERRTKRIHCRTAMSTMRHSTPAAALMSETCVSDISAGDKHSKLMAGDKGSRGGGLKRILSYAASTFCVGSS